MPVNALLRQERRSMNKLFQVRVSTRGRLSVKPSSYLKSLSKEDKIEALTQLWAFYKEQLEKFEETPYQSTHPQLGLLSGEASDYLRKKKELQMYLEVTKRYLSHTKRVTGITIH